jgi:zinc transporter ZupT
MIVVFSSLHEFSLKTKDFESRKQNEKDRMTTSNVTMPSTQWEPLYLSTIAGLSTCIGAAVVFCQPQNEHNNTKIVPPHTMAFSLALAGSVMVTVSIVSILPEVLMENGNGYESEETQFESGEGEFKMINIFSMTMFYRILFFGLGSALYFGLSSWLNVPEPEEVLDGILLGDKSEQSTHNQEFVMKDPIIDNDIEMESEMIELMYNSPSTEDDGILESTCSPLRGRKSTNNFGINNVLEYSPGDNNGKSKFHSQIDDHKNTQVTSSSTRSGNNFCEDGFSFKDWTSGEDLGSKEKRKAWRVAVLLFISLLVHNFPEGLAVAASALESKKLGTSN